MRKALRGFAGTIGSTSGILLAQDRVASGFSLKGNWGTILSFVFLTSLVALVLTSERVWAVFGRRPLLKVGEIGQFWRDANASQSPGDLQVVFVRVRNDRDGGGERATLKDAEIWMEAFTNEGRRIASALGNWLDLSTGQPLPVSAKTMTLPPHRKEYGVEIGGKFLWGDEAWLAGENQPGLGVGECVVRTTIGDGVSKAAVFEWEVVNPGANAELQIYPKKRWRFRKRETALPASLNPLKQTGEKTERVDAASSTSSEIRVFEEARVEVKPLEPADLRNLSDALRSKGGALREREWKRLRGADPTTTRASSVDDVNTWLAEVRDVIGTYYGREAYRVSPPLSSSATAQDLLDAVDRSLPPITNFKKFGLEAL